MTTTPLGAGMEIAPELVLRQALMEQLRLLAGDRRRLEDLVRRTDALASSTAADWSVDLTRAALRMLLPSRPEDEVRVMLGYPVDAAVMPCVSIVMASGSEDVGEAVMGDVIGRSTAMEGASLVERTTLGLDYRSTVQVGSWTTAAEESLLLHALVHESLVLAKGALYGAGVHDLSLSDSGFEPDDKHYPSTGFVPVWQCSIRWTRRTTLRAVAHTTYMVRSSFGSE